MDWRSASPRKSFAAQLGPQRWRALCDAGTSRSYRPGQCLLRQGDHGGFVLALTSGRVRVSALERDGTQLLQALRGPGDLVGEMAMRGEARRTATVVALDRCTAQYLPVARFQRFLESTGAHSALTDYLITKLAETVSFQVQLVHFSPQQRIARLLLDVLALADSAADPAHIPLSQTAIAAGLGLARSTVAKQIALLRGLGVLAPGPRLAVADPRRLREMAEPADNQ